MSEGRHRSDQAQAAVGNSGDEGELPGVGVYWGRAKGSGQGLSEPAGHGSGRGNFDDSDTTRTRALSITKHRCFSGVIVGGIAPVRADAIPCVRRGPMAKRIH
jgi:hypothetical protein